MAGVMEVFNGLAGSFGGDTHILLILLFFTAVIVIYAVFVYYFYRFLASKNLLNINLNQYNQYQNPALAKLFAVIFYIAEYIILLPVITFFWFAVLAMLILVLSEGMGIDKILLISAALVAAVRITAYVSENLSKDLAKMIPFTLIAIAITKPGFFAMEAMIERVSTIPTLFNNLPYYLLFIVGIELVMRGFTSLENIFKTGEIDSDTDEESDDE
ncbi:MAG: hypothetical protein KKF50_00370 [Nanoarchaeota archaeon]|nr:hypothetical protein [Nanoarchaeota archaeon]